jgi:ABC-2 type transport system permease protein
MLLPLTRRALLDGWRPLLWWLLGLVAVELLYLPLFPLIAGPDMSELLDKLPRELVQTIGYDDITSGPGYAQSTFFGLVGFVLLTIAAIGWGTAAIAGDEENGTLELTLAHAVSRTQLVLERSLAIVVKLVALGAVAAAVMLIVNAFVGLDLELVTVLAATATFLALALSTAMVALAAGAITGRRSIALGAGTAVAVLGYVANAVGKLVPDLEWMRGLSPYAWAWAESPLKNGLDGAGFAGLIALSAVALTLALLGFARRDITG